jgi:hypothetical protein
MCCAKRHNGSEKIVGVDERSWPELVNEDLFEWEPLSGLRALAHLLIYRIAGAAPVCLVGSLDGEMGSLPSQMPEILATAVADRLGRDDFRLVVWYPREARYPFRELELSRIRPRELDHDALVVRDAASGDELTRRVRSRTVRFADPRWSRRTEDELARVLGEPAIRELRAYAGLPGDYTPERLFGTTGRRQAGQIRLHNDQTAAQLDAQVTEWSTGPQPPGAGTPEDLR